MRTRLRVASQRFSKQSSPRRQRATRRPSIKVGAGYCDDVTQDHCWSVIDHSTERIDGRSGVQVPQAFPIIAFIEGDGIGVDVTPVMQRVVDAAVEGTYAGKRRIATWERGRVRVGARSVWRGGRVM